MKRGAVLAVNIHFFFLSLTRKQKLYCITAQENIYQSKHRWACRFNVRPCVYSLFNLQGTIYSLQGYAYFDTQVTPQLPT